MRTLLIINGPPYGTERAYNALRLANALACREGEEVRVFLMGDAAACARSGQTLPAPSTASSDRAVPSRR